MFPFVSFIKKYFRKRSNKERLFISVGITFFLILIFSTIVLTQTKPKQKPGALPQVLSATPASPSISILAPKAAKPPCCKKDYPYTYPQKLIDGVLGSDNPQDSAWVEFSPDNINPYFFGVTSYWGFTNSTQLSLAQGVGAKAYRHNAGIWSDVETAKGVYNWSVLDSRLKGAADYGLKPYFLVSSPPAWSQPQWLNTGQCTVALPVCRPGRPPDNLQDYADFIVALINHVNANFPNQTTKVVEVWNEINEYFWKDTEEQYLKMLKATYKAVKAVDPSWRIMAETFSGMELPEFDYLYTFKDENGESMLKKYSDLIAVHPYGGTLGPDDPVEKGWGSFSLLADNTRRIKDIKIPGTPWGWGKFQLIEEDDPSPNILRNWRQVMIKNGDGDKKVWITEMGWHRSFFDGSNKSWPYPPDPKRVAELTSRLFEKTSEYDFIENLSVYSMMNNCSESAGLVDLCNNNAKTNAYYAYQNLATTDGIIIDLSKSPTAVYPSPLFNLKGIKLGSLNSNKDGKKYRIGKVEVSVSTDNISYSSVGSVANTGPESGRVELSLDNINQTARWIKLQITPDSGTSKYLIDEVSLDIPGFSIQPSPSPSPYPNPTVTLNPLAPTNTPSTTPTPTSPSLASPTPNLPSPGNTSPTGSHPSPIPSPTSIQDRIATPWPPQSWLNDLLSEDDQTATQEASPQASQGGIDENLKLLGFLGLISLMFGLFAFVIIP